MNGRRLSAIAFFLLLSLSLPCAAQSGESALQDTARESGYSSVLLVNFLIPGFAQLSQGKTVEGLIYLSGLPMLVAGQVLLLWYDYYSPGGVDLFSLYANPSGSPYPIGTRDPLMESALYAGRALTAAGLAMYALSTYAFHAERTADSRQVDPLSLLTAPFDPGLLLRPEVGAMAVLAAVTQMTPQGLGKAKDFFAAPSQPFLGWYMEPWAALGARVGTQAVLALLVAVGEETFFRGYLADSDGIATSTALDCGRYAYFLALPFEDRSGIWLDIVAGGAWSLYSAALSRSDGNPRASIAFRFWYGLLVSTYLFLVDPAAADDIGISIRISY